MLSEEFLEDLLQKMSAPIDPLLSEKERKRLEDEKAVLIFKFEQTLIDSGRMNLSRIEATLDKTFVHEIRAILLRVI